MQIVLLHPNIREHSWLTKEMTSKAHKDAAQHIESLHIDVHMAFHYIIMTGAALVAILWFAKQKTKQELAMRENGI